jgi:hypothetical protein
VWVPVVVLRLPEDISIARRRDEDEEDAPLL